MEIFISFSITQFGGIVICPLMIYENLMLVKVSLFFNLYWEKKFHPWKFSNNYFLTCPNGQPAHLIEFEFETIISMTKYSGPPWKFGVWQHKIIVSFWKLLIYFFFRAHKNANWPSNVNFKITNYIFYKVSVYLSHPLKIVTLIPLVLFSFQTSMYYSFQIQILRTLCIVH